MGQKIRSLLKEPVLRAGLFLLLLLLGASPSARATVADEANSAPDQLRMMSDSQVDAMKAACEGAGYGRSKGDELLALAIKLSHCDPGFISRTTRAVGVHQVPPELYPKLAEEFTDKDQNKLVKILMGEDKSKAMDIAAAAFELMKKKAGGSTEGGLCAYADQLPQFKKQGYCFASQEMGLYVKRINGEPVSELSVTNHDMDDPDYGTISYDGGNVKSLNCQDNEGVWARSLAQGKRVYRTAAAESVRTTIFAGFEAASKKGVPKYHPIKKAVCISKLILYFDVVRALMMGPLWLEGVLLVLAEQMLAEMCEYVVGSVTILANNLLNSLCIPIPNISLDFNLGTIATKSCDGITPGQAYAEGLNYSASALISEYGLPKPNTIKSYRYETPSVQELINMLAGSSLSGTKEKKAE